MGQIFVAMLAGVCSKKAGQPEHVLNKIHECTFRPKYFLNFFDLKNLHVSLLFHPHPIFITTKHSFITAHFVHHCTLKHPLVTATAMERFEYLSDEMTEGRSSVRVEEERVERGGCIVNN